MKGMRGDHSTPDTRLSDDMNRYNPAVTEELTQLMLGGLPTGRAGSPLHCRVRYFDPERRRAGIPDDVAALVERFTDDATVVQLVNLNQARRRHVIVQAGAFGEHRITSVLQDDRSITVGASTVSVFLEPGAGGAFTLMVDRYVNPPTLAFPWP